MVWRWMMENLETQFTPWKSSHGILLTDCCGVWLWFRQGKVFREVMDTTILIEEIKPHTWPTILRQRITEITCPD